MASSGLYHTASSEFFQTCEDIEEEAKGEMNLVGNFILLLENVIKYIKISNHYVTHLKLIEYCMSTIVQLKHGNWIQIKLSLLRMAGNNPNQTSK